MLQRYTILNPQGTKIVVLGYKYGQLLVSKFYHEQENEKNFKSFTYKGEFKLKGTRVY